MLENYIHVGSDFKKNVRSRGREKGNKEHIHGVKTHFGIIFHQFH